MQRSQRRTGALAGVAMGSIWLASGCVAREPNRPEAVVVDTRRMSVENEHSVPFEGGTLAYSVRGDGPRALLFVHGANADRSHWHRQHELELEGRRLLFLDLPGHGASQPAPEPFTVDGLARAVAAVLDHQGLERAVLVGHSNGALVVRQFLRLYPERTEALVALDGCWQPSLTPEIIDWMRAALERPDSATFLRSMFASSPKGNLLPEDVAILEAAFECPAATMLGWLDAMADEALWAADPIDVPLLVINTTRAPQGTPEYEAFVRSLAPEVDYQRLDGVGHFIQMERPEVLEERLRAFLR